MRHIVGKISTSTFQRYKVYANRSSDERVMAPGSWGVGAVLVCFSGEDSGQTGEATGELRVAHRSRSRHLSNAPGLAGQLAASRKDSAREGAFATFSCKVLDLRETELGMERYGSANKGRRSVFGPLEDIFPIEIPARPGEILTIREFHAVHGCVLFPMCPGLRINLLRSSRCRISAILISSESLCYLLSKGGGQFDSAFGPVNGSVKLRGPQSGQKRLGQTLVKLWSTLVKLGQSSPNFGKCIPDHVLRVSGYSGPQSGQKRLGQTLVKLGQSSSDLGKCILDLVLRLFDVTILCRIRPAWFGLPRFTCRHPRKSRG
uniref:Uncharacterized protein n=1 Tax=Fagus sylvatica TaxID=28930 RepID=A0A2N9HYW3_FAGSY